MQRDVKFQCSRCRLKYYATEDAQRRDWERHKTECKPFPVALPPLGSLTAEGITYEKGAHAGDIDKLTRENSAYRRVLSTTATQQLVLMSLSEATGDDIDWEIHPFTTQFIKVEEGRLLVLTKIGDSENTQGVELTEGGFITILPNTHHYVKGIDAKLYSIYSLPEHDPKTFQATKPLSGGGKH